MAGLFDAIITYQFVKLISQSFTEWDAYKLGIINEDGVVLRKRNTLKTQEEKNSFTSFHVVIKNIKKIMEKSPAGKSKLLSFAAALYLMKEGKETNATLEQLEEQINAIAELNSTKRKFLEFTAKEQMISEDMSASTTTGDVAMVDTPMDFAGTKVFKVPTSSFMKARMGKKKYAKWFDYVGESDNAEDIRSYGLKHPKAPIILQDSQTGAMMYLRYGR